MEITEIAQEALLPGLGIYSAKLTGRGKSYHFEIILDGWSHPHGSVSLDDCEKYSQNFTALIDRLLIENRGDLPSGLLTDNYTLEVASAGAERALRGVDDFQRFAAQPMKIHFMEEDKRRVMLVNFTGKDENDKLQFQTYIPAKERKQSKKKKETLQLNFDELIKANLYLDF